jgi:hypothetical protein
MRSPCPHPTPADRDSPLVLPDPRRDGGSGDGGWAATAAATERVTSPLDWWSRREPVASAGRSCDEPIRRDRCLSRCGSERRSCSDARVWSAQMARTPRVPPPDWFPLYVCRTCGAWDLAPDGSTTTDTAPDAPTLPASITSSPRPYESNRTSAMKADWRGRQGRPCPPSAPRSWRVSARLEFPRFSGHLTACAATARKDGVLHAQDPTRVPR